nr:MAG TPA: hypothetical protein [Caudoviricetes sp.]
MWLTDRACYRCYQAWQRHGNQGYSFPSLSSLYV